MTFFNNSKFNTGGLVPHTNADIVLGFGLVIQAITLVTPGLAPETQNTTLVIPEKQTE